MGPLAVEKPFPFVDRLFQFENSRLSRYIIVKLLENGQFRGQSFSHLTHVQTHGKL